MEENRNFIFAIFTWPVRAKILSRFQFEGKAYVWISQVRRVKSWQKVHIFDYLVPTQSLNLRLGT